MKIYIAMAETEDGNRIMENAYRTRSAAEQAAESMVKDLTEGAKWKVVPIIEDMDLIDE
jgi:hypothetical protein